MQGLSLQISFQSSCLHTKTPFFWVREGKSLLTMATVHFLIQRPQQSCLSCALVDRTLPSPQNLNLDAQVMAVCSISLRCCLRQSKAFASLYLKSCKREREDVGRWLLKSLLWDSRTDSVSSLSVSLLTSVGVL